MVRLDRPAGRLQRLRHVLGGPAASLVSTVPDLNRFFGMLLAGEIVNQSSLAQMQRTVPVIAQDGQRIDYGLGLQKVESPGCGTFWGHDGTVWGARPCR